MRLSRLREVILVSSLILSYMEKQGHPTVFAPHEYYWRNTTITLSSCQVAYPLASRAPESQPFRMFLPVYEYA
jgi:hypothetical protein